MRDGFPLDRYTPHGYLGNPRHALLLRPLGVIRSVAPLGLAWHLPFWAGLATRETAALRLGLAVGGRRFALSPDFADADLHADYHSRRVLRLRWQAGWLAATATWLAVGDHALALELELHASARLPSSSAAELGRPGAIAVVVAAEAERRLGASGRHEAGLYALASAEVAALGVHPDGGALVLGADQPWQAARAFHSSGGWQAWLVGEEAPGAPAEEEAPRRFAAVALRWCLTPRPGAPGEGWHWRLRAALGRGPHRAAARRAAGRGVRRLPAALPAALAADDEEWRATPRLAGDWPPHWRRCWVYDLETLRMVVREPVGRLRRRWDGMQVQAPRLVLAEAAFDALLLSHADPALAQELLLGAFADALAPNLPCIREDGSANMVAADGSECGTAPSWGYPIWCADLLWRRSGDAAWRTALYPHLARYLDWWLRERADAEGWLHFACGWESGQDRSPRFGPGYSGADPLPDLRPVDLHAAVAQGAAILARWAEALGHAAEAARWREVAGRVRERVAALWDEAAGWFLDQHHAPTGVLDPVQLAPLLAGCASPAQLERLRPRFATLPLHAGAWPPLAWPLVAWTALEAARRAGALPPLLDDLFALQDAAYRDADTAEAGPGRLLPGVAGEFWSHSGRGGTEGYGWGAAGILWIVREYLGLREPDWAAADDVAFHLAPALPAPLRQPGRRYRLDNLPLRGRRLDLEVRVEGADLLSVGVRLRSGEPIALHGPDGGPARPGPDGFSRVALRPAEEAHLLLPHPQGPAASPPAV